MVYLKIFENDENSKWVNKKNRVFVVSRKLCSSHTNNVRDMDFVETKFFYKNHVIDLNLKNENMSKKGPRKRKKCKNE